RREAIVGLKAELPQPGAYRRHLIRLGTRFDDRGHEGGELRRRPAALRRQFGVNEIETVEGVLGVLDATIHVHAAPRAGVALDRRIAVHDLEFVGTFADRKLVARYNRHLRELRASRLPALGAATDVVVGGLRGDTDLDGTAGALAHQGAPGKVGGA